jgi:ubiquinone/menaquinone biosynthesis C-methylase UbiE
VSSAAQLQPIAIRGGDTAHSLNLAKRVALVERAAGGLIGKRVLDCGCGSGAYADSYAASGASVVGVEYSRDKLRAEHRRAGARARLLVGDLAHLPIASNSFDVAVLNEVLEHVPDESRALAEIWRALRPGATLIVLSPNRLYPFESHGVAWRANGRALPVYLPFVPYVPLVVGGRIFDYWARNYWPWQLRATLRAAGFEIARTGFVAQTFENISGRQPALLRVIKPALRKALALFERVPVVRSIASVSQWIVARKATPSHQAQP